ncbi:unnamed protein product [Urochloa decumbens]|uniref:F-box protein n=1 Tax=Urochloa decumbens TaxID=240449 RepID=A0ABC9F6F7_9POAL
MAKAGEDEILEGVRGTLAVIASSPKKRKTEAVDGASGTSIRDDVTGNILARLPARTAVACTALSKHHRRMIRSSEFRSLHLHLAPPLPRPQIAYIATAPIRRRPEHKPVSGYYAFHVAGAAAGLRRNDPMRVLAGGRYLGTRYANTCNGVVLISGEEFSAPARCALWNPSPTTRTRRSLLLTLTKRRSAPSTCQDGTVRSSSIEMSGRPCVVAKDGGNRTLLRLTVDRQWERRCVIAVKGGRYHKGDLRYCPIIGVWDCGEVLVMYFKGELGVICLYDVATRKMYKADLPCDLTPKCSDYELCWGYRPTLVSPGNIVVDKLNQVKEMRQDHTAEIMQLMKPVEEQEMRKGRKATLSAVCFMELLAYIMRKLPDDLQNLVEMPLIDSEYSISFSEHKVVAKDGGGAPTSEAELT